MMYGCWWKRLPMPCPQNCSFTLNPCRLANSLPVSSTQGGRSSLDCLADHVEALAWAAGADGEVERLLRRGYELAPRLVRVGAKEGSGGVAVEAVKVECQVEVDDVLGLQWSAFISSSLGKATHPSGMPSVCQL